MSDKKNTPDSKKQSDKVAPPKIDPALLMQMLQQQAQNKAAGGKAIPGAPVPAKKKFTIPPAKEIATKFLSTLAKAVTFIDRLINFVTKPKDEDRNEIVQAARSPILFGFYIITFFVVFGGIWAGCAPLDSAATALGTVITKIKRQEIQHNEGGIIEEIFVQSGDKVKAGDPLLQLDDTTPKASFDNALNHYRSSLAHENRLMAERDNLEQVVFADFLEQDKELYLVQKLFDTQTNLFIARQESFKKQIETKQQAIAQIKQKHEGLASQLSSAQRNLEYVQERLQTSRELLAKGFVNKDAVQNFEVKESEALAQLSNVKTSLNSTDAQLQEIELQILNIKVEHESRILEELSKVQAQTDEAELRYLEARDVLARTIIRSPVDGIVNKMSITTIGSIIGKGVTIAEVSPLNEQLIIEAKIPHKEIQSIRVGLPAKMRFSAFKSRTSPVFMGTVTSLSPDVVEDRVAAAQMQNAQGDTFYVAIIELDMEEFNRIAAKKNFTLHPGMQAEVQIVHGSRTLLKYLLDPVLDTMFNALREK